MYGIRISVLPKIYSVFRKSERVDDHMTTDTIEKKSLTQ